MKTLFYFIIFFTFNALSSFIYAAPISHYYLDCRETYIDGMLPTTFTLHDEIPVHVITQRDIELGKAYPNELGTIGGKLETKLGVFKIIATVLKEEPWLMIIFPDGTHIFNHAFGMDYSSLGSLPKIGKTAHKLTCEVTRKQ